MKRWTLVGGVCALLALPAAADEQALRAAAKHFAAGKQAHFKAAAAKIDKNAAVYPLVQYWSGVFALRNKKPAAARAFVAETASPYLRGRARRELLEFYAGKGDWKNFAAYAADADGCAPVLADLRAGGGGDAARALWRADEKLNDDLCMRLYRLARAQGVLSGDDVWIKLRTLAGKKRLTASRRLLRAFPGLVRYRTLRNVVNRSARYIRGKHGLRARANRELVMIAAMATARRKPELAIARWRKFSRYFSPAENDHVWTVLAAWAARWHRADALPLYERTGGDYADTDSRAWRVRAALRAGDYALVLRLINAMPEDERALSAWRYWRAFAMRHAGDDAAAAAAMRALAAEEDDYYGLLAREAAGLPLVTSAPPPAKRPPDGDLAMALAVYRAGLMPLADRIWRHAIRHADDGALLAGAQAAAALNWNLASINAADKVAAADAHALRFPLPYRDVIDKYSRRFDLDAAFVYGLIRQESRFMPKIVSSANARGLMQVIPRTARLVARKHGYTRYRLSRLTRVDTNVIIGTTYLSDLAKSLDNEPAKIAAGYNAGPGRVRRWYKASPMLMVAIENIPITETRLYVKHVLGNRLHYAARLGGSAPAMRDNLRRPIRAGARVLRRQDAAAVSRAAASVASRAITP